VEEVTYHSPEFGRVMHLKDVPEVLSDGVQPIIFTDESLLHIYLLCVVVGLKRDAPPKQDVSKKALAAKDDRRARATPNRSLERQG